MTRTIAIIICFIAALFLVPVQEAYSEILEYESETEVECCAVSCSEQQFESCRKKPERPDRNDARNVCLFIAAGTGVPMKTPPARILHCVFRE